MSGMGNKQSQQVNKFFEYCKEGNEEKVKKYITANRAVVDARDPDGVSCHSPDMTYRIYILLSMSMLTSCYISII